ncbi:MAG: hypothetical protein PHH54_02775 [Candidatus Nanoarchaeia archaeon]|nr:hypothetical protein [Candidatus Nanoarchaeia archaeon]MDD5740884.1 hypothetical protein [Candidatus Nanoarchaeia archaeon]
MANKKDAKKRETKKAISSKKLINKKNIQSRQIMWTIILMVCLILIIIVVPFIKTNFINKFRYITLDFQKTQLGDMYFYSTKIPVADSSNNIVGAFSINFRNDPRELEDMNIKMTTTVPVFIKDKAVYISPGKIERNCIESSAATLTLSGFLRQFAQLNISAGISDKKVAEENNFPYITCANSKKNTVIEIIEGNETKIEQISPDCYRLEYKDCDIMKVSERFILLILEGYMKNFERKDSFLDVFK